MAADDKLWLNFGPELLLTKVHPANAFYSFDSLRQEHKTAGAQLT